MSPKRIHKLRRDLKMTQAQLAERIGAQRHTVARWELGQNKPRGANLKLLLELEKTINKERGAR
jgi:DNA-binding transcriptional regulator YiaG